MSIFKSRTHTEAMLLRQTLDVWRTVSLCLIELLEITFLKKDSTSFFCFINLFDKNNHKSTFLTLNYCTRRCMGCWVNRMTKSMTKLISC